jgi:hypothetical protein
MVSGSRSQCYSQSMIRVVVHTRFSPWLADPSWKTYGSVARFLSIILRSSPKVVLVSYRKTAGGLREWPPEHLPTLFTIDVNAASMQIRSWEQFLLTQPLRALRLCSSFEERSQISLDSVMRRNPSLAKAEKCSESQGARGVTLQGDFSA